MKRPENAAYSLNHTFNVTAIGLGPSKEIYLEVHRSDGPSIADTFHVLTTAEATALANNLLQSVADAPDQAPEQELHPIPPADMAQYLYGLPYGEES